MMGPATLVDLLDRGGEVRCPDGTQAAADLRDASARLAAAMRRHGIGWGDRVGLRMPNGPGWLAAAFALSATFKAADEAARQVVAR